MQGFELRGVPASLARDGWWLSSVTETGDLPKDPPRGALAGGSLAGGIAGLIALLILGDFLFWQQYIGVSLALFVPAILLVASQGHRPHKRLRAVLICAVGAAPVADSVQLLSVSFLLAGLILGLATLRLPPEGGARALLSALVGLLAALPAQWLNAPRQLHSPGAGRFGPGLTRQAFGQLRQAAFRGRWLRDWAVPLGGSLVFAALILGANPVLLQLGEDHFSPLVLIQRLIFWLGLAILILPFLGQAETAPMPLNTPILRQAWRLPGLNPRSVLRALVMFNLLIGAQMISDASILIGGAALPEGVTPAEYARQGAWPLLATAMLAGAFTLASRPFWQEDRLIRPLLLLWLVQNIALTGAAALRLDLYIDTYGLTFLRLYALIWMGVVACGLGLMVWQNVFSKSNPWLLSRLDLVGISVLYTCSFINFTSIVAARNLAQERVDFRYVCDLGPLAADVVRGSDWFRKLSYGQQNNCATARAPVIHGWRDWGFRSARVIRNLDVTNEALAMERAG